MKGAALLRGVSRINVWQSFEMSETFAKARASRNIIETVSLSQRNHLHVNVCAPVELAPSQQATNAWRVDQVEHACVIDPMLQETDQPLLADRIEEASEVRVKNIVHLCAVDSGDECI